MTTLLTAPGDASIGVPVIFEDDALLALDKPSGLLVHRGWGRDRIVLADLVRDYLGGSSHPIHRLDRQTSGVILFAKHRDVAASLGEMFDTGRVRKTYVALVRGVPPETGTVDHPIPRTEGGERVPAVTDFTRLATVETDIRPLSIVEARPRTGRLHQIRRHLKHLSHPLIGDANYGKGALNRAIRDRYGLCRLGLHALRLRVDHPVLGATLDLFASLPDDFASPLRAMGVGDDFFSRLG